VVRFFAYLVTKGIHGGIYAIGNLDNRDVLATIMRIRRGDVFKINRLGCFILNNFDTTTTYQQGIEERYIYLHLHQVWNAEELDAMNAITPAKI
jgi:hypothetical protein